MERVSSFKVSNWDSCDIHTLPPIPRNLPCPLWCSHCPGCTWNRRWGSCWPSTMCLHCLLDGTFLSKPVSHGFDGIGVGGVILLGHHIRNPDQILWLKENNYYTINTLIFWMTSSPQTKIWRICSARDLDLAIWNCENIQRRRFFFKSLRCPAGWARRRDLVPPLIQNTSLHHVFVAGKKFSVRFMVNPNVLHVPLLVFIFCWHQKFLLELPHRLAPLREPTGHEVIPQ